MAELITRREGASGWVVFSNVAKHNAVTYGMWQALPEAVASFERDPEVRVIVMTGEGDKAFISGADISEFERARGSVEASASYNEAVAAGYQSVLECAKPTIARIRGICFGGGLGLAITCDMRICSDDARFSLPAARLGLGYSYASARRFVELVGPAYAAEILFTARRFDAGEALQMRLVNRVVPAADLERVMAEYVSMFADNAPLSVAAAKRSIAEALKDPESRDLRAVQAMIDACFASEDYREGRTAFMEKRRPKFRGR